MREIFKDMKVPAFLIVYIFSSVSGAREWMNFYNNARSLAMGGVSVAMSSDETALYRNPANLGSIRGSYLTLLDPELEISKNFLDQVTSQNLTKAFEPSSINETLLAKPNEYYHARMQLTPNFVGRNFGVGLIYQNQVNAIMNSTSTEMDYLSYDDMGVVLGASYRFLDGKIKLGASARAFNRIEIDNQHLVNSGSLEKKDIAKEGTAVAFDAAIMFQLPVAMLPSLGVVVRDIADTKFDKRDKVRLETSLGQPSTVKQSVDVGFSITPIESKSRRSLLSFEYQDVTNSREEAFSKKHLHIGFETSWNDIMYLRAGLNQGYWTAGFEIASEHTSWMLSTYGEEIGTESLPLEDRRFLTKFTLRF